MNIYKKVLQQCSGQSLDKTNCNMLNAYFMIKKYNNLFDCTTNVSIQLHSQLNIQKRKYDFLVRLRTQMRLMDNYRQSIEQQIAQLKNKPASSHYQLPPATQKATTDDKAHLEEKRRELFEFLLKNNEATRNNIQEYKME